LPGRGVKAYLYDTHAKNKVGHNPQRKGRQGSGPPQQVAKGQLQGAHDPQHLDQEEQGKVPASPGSFLSADFQVKEGRNL